MAEVRCPNCQSRLSVTDIVQAQGHKLEVLAGTPRYTIQEWVDVVMARRGAAMEALRPELHALLVGLVEQLSAYADHHEIDLARIQFGQIRWVKDGCVVIDLAYNGMPIHPEAIRY